MDSSKEEKITIKKIAREEATSYGKYAGGFLRKIEE